MLPYSLRVRQPVACVSFDYAVVMITDCLGVGFLVHHKDQVPAAMDDGWLLVSDELTQKEANQLREDLSLGHMSIEAVWS